MTDNFNNYRQFIELVGGLPETNEKGNLDKFYVIELIRRGKDNPNMSAANYHFKNYHIYSWHDLDKYEQEIKDVCRLLKMRAYASVNYKLMSQIALDTLAEEARRIAAHDYKQYNHIFDSCLGKYVDGKNNLWILDFDEKLIGSDIMAISRFINSMDSLYKENVIFRMPTKSGHHFITRPFNLQKFNEGFVEVFRPPLPDVKKNHLTLLYENLE